ncbi:hypothetical protein BSKO_04855 [Bryopsis sp. KO-2023]|nr:hypothetical protein BSKO_04855 [Bryopsis sp. KO-2023]
MRGVRLPFLSLPLRFCYSSTAHRCSWKPRNHVVPGLTKSSTSLKGPPCAANCDAIREVSFWANVSQVPEDELFTITGKYINDPHPHKLNVGIGAYRTEEGKAHVLDVVRKVEEIFADTKALTKEYLPIPGTAKFREEARKSLFGDCLRADDGSIVTHQTVSGAGALRLGCDLLKAHHESDILCVPDPGWTQYAKIFPASGLRTPKIRYFDYEKRCLDIEGFLEDLRKAEPGSAVILQVCGHNPTGVDPTREQWHQILEVMQSRRLLPFFDNAYQGFGSGDLDVDAYPLRLFEQAGMDMLVAQSFSKNMGLYGERCGALSVACQTPEQAQCMLSQLSAIIMTNYGIPPRHGSDIATAILEDPALSEEWKGEVKGMVDRMRNMRELLYLAIMKRNTPGNWECIVDQVGMFAFIGLSEAQAKHLTSKWHVYLPTNGRISMAAVSRGSVNHLADAIDDAVRNVHDD